MEERKEIELYGGPADGLRMIVGDKCCMVHVPDGEKEHLYGMQGDLYRYMYCGFFEYVSNEPAVSQGEEGNNSERTRR